MERGPNLKIKGTGSHLPLATICVISGKSPNLFRLKALVCEINILALWEMKFNSKMLQICNLLHVMFINLSLK